MRIDAKQLHKLTNAIFLGAGCPPAEAACVATHLVEANLVGHDSHGVIRIPTYVTWLKDGRVVADQSIEVAFENDVIAVVDGRFGLGQAIGEQAMRLGIAKCSGHGVAVIALRNSGHLGRIGDWPLMLAEAGLLSLHFVNTTGAGILVAPFGGINRRLSANPIAAGIPLAGAAPMILDISSCTMAEGKIRVALNKGVDVPEDCLIGPDGKPTTDPRVFYGDPPGAILPIAGHKGHGLSILCEILAGALTGGGCSNIANAGRVANSMLSIILDPWKLVPSAEFAAEIELFTAWVKSSATVAPDGEILMPGEIEERTKSRRLAEGIEIDDKTWSQIEQTASSVGVTAASGSL